ncbi:phage protein Gp27 family protein [Treponema pectinovorum]|uniref:phage protein Gp27 family protein n=1 Tax=Treponema pectinovorum TaxID=164 RepID=UPI0011C8B927|nr:phage protein Gp27 family protein [Treponema pectinovorum]
MPKRNKIEIQGLVERIVSMYYQDKMSQKDIADTLKAEGYDISKSGVGRTLIDQAAQMKAYKDSAKKAVAIVNELGKTPGLNIAEASVQLVQAKLLEEVNKFEDFSTISPEELLKAVARNSDAQTRIAKIKLEYERGYKKGLFEAAKSVESEGKKAGWSDESVKFVKEKILGLEVSYDDDKQKEQQS